MKGVADSNEFFNCFELISKFNITFLLQENYLKSVISILLFSCKKSNQKCKAASVSLLQIMITLKNLKLAALKQKIFLTAASLSSA